MAKRYRNNSNLSDEFNITQKVRDELNENPLLKPKKLCKIIGLDYYQYGNYIKKLRSQWKRDYRKGLRPTSPICHFVRAVVYVPKSCDRAFAVGCGWVLSRNRNRCLFWRSVLGRVEWFTTGRVIVHVKKPQTMARVKRLLSDCFFGTGLIHNPVVLDKFLAQVRWKGAHDVYETNERLPHKIIENYVESHGIRIVTGDASHPNSIEVQWCRPDWLEDLMNMKELNMQYLHDFSKFMKELATPKRMDSNASGMIV